MKQRKRIGGEKMRELEMQFLAAVYELKYSKRELGPSSSYSLSVKRMVDSISKEIDLLNRSFSLSQ